MSDTDDSFNFTFFDDHTRMPSDESNILTYSGNSSHYDQDCDSSQIQPEQEHNGIFDQDSQSFQKFQHENGMAFEIFSEDRPSDYVADDIFSMEESIPARTEQISKKPTYKRVHLNGQRRKKGQKNKLQKSVNGYPTKNFLPFGRNRHINFIVKYFKRRGRNALQMFQQLRALKSKVGVTMTDYQTIYNIPELEEAWTDFFSKKILYRQLMVSRTQPAYKLIYVRFLHKFEEAFRLRRFIGISRKVREQDTLHQQYQQ